MPPTSSAGKPINVKLILIGEQSVGKSCLLLRFLDDQWSPEEIPVSTLGVAFRERKMEVKGKKVRMNIWDTAGQERFRSIVTGYYRGAHGAILVYDISNRETFEALPGWYNIMETYVPASVAKILVGSKVDQESSRQVTTEEGQQFAEQMDSLFIEASAMTAVGVAEIFTGVVEKILDTPELWDPAAAEGQSTDGGTNLHDNAEAQGTSGCKC